MQFSSKEEWRKALLTKRNATTDANRTDWDNRLINQFLDHPQLNLAKRVSCYIGYGSEVNTMPLIHRLWQLGIQVCVPRIISKHKGMEMVDIASNNDLTSGKYGIPAPKNQMPALTDEPIDIILVPGLIFDQQGYRIGYGGGFYDRFLVKHPLCYKISLAYPFQKVDALPHDWYDIPVDEVIYPLD